MDKIDEQLPKDTDGCLSVDCWLFCLWGNETKKFSANRNQRNKIRDEFVTSLKQNKIGCEQDVSQFIRCGLAYRWERGPERGQAFFPNPSFPYLVHSVVLFHYLFRFLFSLQLHNISFLSAFGWKAFRVWQVTFWRLFFLFSFRDL